MQGFSLIKCNHISYCIIFLALKEKFNQYKKQKQLRKLLANYNTL